LTVGSNREEQRSRARIGLFSDIPQEELVIEYINVPFELNFSEFKAKVAGLGLVRYLTKELSLPLAQTLFHDDSIVYHHTYPKALEYPDQPFSRDVRLQTRDYEARDNGWCSHVLLPERAGMLGVKRDWRAINTEADWKSLLQLLKTSPRPAFMRHKSVEDRMDFINLHKDIEQLEIAKTGGHYLNPFLSRHMEEVYPASKVNGTSPPSLSQHPCHLI
jgi:hypothetical protein